MASPAIKRFSTYLKESERLDEGGGFGHLAHPFDIETFTFKDLRDIIDKSLSGELEWSREKTDGQNLLVSWRGGRLIAARNKSHLKNAGENAMGVDGVKAMFAGRGTIETAFVEAARDLETAVKELSADQRDKIFMNGKRFMSVEVLYSSNPNVIHYGVDELRFHGTLEYNEAGEPISQLNKADGAALAKMLQKVQAHKQSTFTIKEIDKLRLQKMPNYDTLRAKHIAELGKIMKGQRLSWNNTIKDYTTSYWTSYVAKNFAAVDEATKKALVNRWAHGIKTPNINTIAKGLDKALAQKVKNFDKREAKNESKRMHLPFEVLFLRVGVEVLQGIDTLIAVNPDHTLDNMRQKFHSTVKTLEKSTDPDVIAKLRLELDRINKIGGIEKLVPTEGITFFYKGELLKLTGLFAPLNQISGMLWRL